MPGSLPSSDVSRRHASLLAITLGIALCYLILGVAGLLLGSPSPVFPPAGLALAALL